MKRDGIEEKRADTSLTGPAAWLSQMVGAVPLDWWTKTFESAPARLVELAQKTNNPHILLDGWTTAAVRQRKSDWALALLPVAEGSIRLVELIEVLSPAQTEQYLIGLLRQREPAFLQHPGREILRHYQPNWSLDLAREVFGRIMREQQGNYVNLFALAGDLDVYARRLPLTYIDEIIQTLTNAESKLYGQEPFIRLLRFRKTMHEEFNR